MNYPMSLSSNSTMNPTTPSSATAPAEAHGHVPDSVTAAVLVHSTSLEGTHAVVQGPDFNQPLSLNQLLASYSNIGFPRVVHWQAIDLINKMRNWRLSDEPINPDETDESLLDPAIGRKSNAKSFSATRPTWFHKMIDVIVTTAGGVEEDIIKCLGKTYMGDFSLKGRDLRMKGLNRIGNLLVPNDNYCKFEDWVMPEKGTVWTPSTLIDRLGAKINHPDSIYYWCHKNQIPVYCPAITDGSLGDMIYFHNFKNPGLIIDLVRDIRSINDQAVFAKKTGMIILGGGVVKHHICNANLMRNGADYAVLVNTAQEFDGSDAGARPDEAVSWGKIRLDGESVKVYADAAIVFPLLVAGTFAKRDEETAVAPEKQ
ncbi:putative deoxyhypusine synthase [Catenaria anguillulae PL171]|uniref:deoxyhypusine synthase n=1 Tax=Catenaria anguillulae PL171 TaxID=765915 RepID=A0A1Y2HSH8_9FUNG|nr:putative deoxyhypusine synthase [Catenaria anguillulae PL171]